MKGKLVGVHNAIKAASSKLPAGYTQYTQCFAQGTTQLTYSAQSVQERAFVLGGSSMPLRKSSFNFVHVQTLPSEHVRQGL